MVRQVIPGRKRTRYHRPCSMYTVLPQHALGKHAVHIQLISKLHRTVLIRAEICIPVIVHRKGEQKRVFVPRNALSNIRMEISFQKEPVREPEAIYFALPLRLEAGWQCCYDTAGEIVKLDEEQLGSVCRDWVTPAARKPNGKSKRAVPLFQIPCFSFHV